MTPKDRKFIFTYFLADDTMSIFEIVPKNAGRAGGRYLVRQVCFAVQKIFSISQYKLDKNQ